MRRMTYANAGVNIKGESSAIAALVEEVGRTLLFRRGRRGESLMGIGHFSGLIKITDELALAIGCDGVGTKLLIAQALNTYDTIGIDLVAMNANDVICVGAEPLSFVDYLAMERPDERITREIGKGLARGAEQAGISIVGGELATVPEIVKGLDLAGMILGVVNIDEIITGEGIEVGDVVIGLKSSGIHSNGLTLARKVLLSEYKIDQEVFMERSVGEELLVPTKIYVKEVLNVIEKLQVKGLANITGGGLGNLWRLTNLGFCLDFLPEPQEVFKEIQKLGNVSDEEMYSTFNMGVGFCIVVPQEEAEESISILEKHGTKAWKLGRITERLGKKKGGVKVEFKDKHFILY